jgi:membrane protein
MVVATCLILNNLLSFLYVSVVLSKMSFYSTVSIVPILMFGLYVFWLMVLFGGVLTYAVQNANNITADRLWNQVSPRTRRLLNLAAFLQISRAFLRGKPGLTSEEIAQILRVPAALINEGLGRLTDLHILSAVEITTKDGEHEVRYQPGRPLHKLTLGKFHLALDMLGNTEGDDTLQATDPLLQQYLQSLAQFETGPLLQKTFAELLSDEKSGVTNFPYRL